MPTATAGMSGRWTRRNPPAHATRRRSGAPGVAPMPEAKHPETGGEREPGGAEPRNRRTGSPRPPSQQPATTSDVRPIPRGRSHAGSLRRSTTRAALPTMTPTCAPTRSSHRPSQANAAINARSPMAVPTPATARGARRSTEVDEDDGQGRRTQDAEADGRAGGLPGRRHEAEDGAGSPPPRAGSGGRSDIRTRGSAPGGRSTRRPGCSPRRPAGGRRPGRTTAASLPKDAGGCGRRPH